MKSLRILGWCLPLVGAAAVVAWLCRPGPPQPAPEEGPSGPPWFEDFTDRVGLDFVHDAGPLGSFFMPEALGSGAALFDCNGDGLLDIYLLQNGGPKGARNRLYLQQPDGTFRASADSGLEFAGHCMGVAVGDVNNDGLPDVLVTEYGGIRLFLNRGGGKFQEVTKYAGLANPAWGASAAFLDYDRDGWLDLVVVNYVDYDPSWPCTSTSGRRDYCAPRTFPGRVTRLFRNRTGDGKGVRFEDVTEGSGLGDVRGPGLGVLCADFDGDGWPDIFVANDGAPNRLWINQRDKKTFKEEAFSRGVAYNRVAQAEAGMGVAYGDVNGDLLSDLFVTHLTEERHTLWRRQWEPPGTYTDVTIESRLAAGRWRGTGFGTVLADFNNDGALDLAIVNGRVSWGASDANPALGPHWSHYAERNQLFANDGTGRFRDRSTDEPALCGTPNVARGLAVGDVTGSGAPDLLVTTAGGRARLYRNVAPNRGHWLLVRAVDPALKRDAYGAEVFVTAGGKRQLRLVNPGYSYLCSNDPRAHFGLGAATRVEKIVVRWPGGKEETFDGCPADQEVELRKGEGPRVRPVPRRARR